MVTRVLSSAFTPIQIHRAVCCPKAVPSIQRKEVNFWRLSQDYAYKKWTVSIFNFLFVLLIYGPLWPIVRKLKTIKVKHIPPKDSLYDIISLLFMALLT